MAVSKRLRYEVLRRDGFTCRYCGLRSDRGLVTDHVLPVALGGYDVAENLVACCKDCNEGKAASNPDEPLVQDVSQDAFRWAVARRRVAAQMEAENTFGYEAGQLLQLWNNLVRSLCRSVTAAAPPDAYHTIRSWLVTGLPDTIIADAMELTLSRQTVYDSGAWRYFCKIVWDQVRELETRAFGLIQRGEV